MASLREKRKRIEELVLETVRRIDNSKMDNFKRYEAMFKFMNDADFEKWASSMGKKLDDTIQMFQLPFEEMKLSQIKDAAEYLKIPLEEYIWFRHHDPEGIRTKMKVPVGFVHIKRVQQLLAKKNKYALDVEETELKTGQVKGESKVTSVTDPETFALTAINADAALREFLGPRADAQISKNQMYAQISQDGFATLEGLSKDVSQSTTLNTIDTYLLASGIRSDLVTNSLKTNFTIEEELKKK
jgi:hypothetical protein